MSVTVLYTRKDSIYKSLGCDCYDIDRDARNFNGNQPVIAHPPCRAWGRLRKFAKPRPDEKLLAITAVNIIRTNGGVLEHPSFSTLWAERCLPRPGQIADDGSFSIDVNQYWFGHKAEKRTWLYIKGIRPVDVPAYPLNFNAIEYVVKPNRYTKSRCKKIISVKEREATPELFAKWLIELASKINSNHESWRYCHLHGYWDARKDGLQCPCCKK